MTKEHVSPNYILSFPIPMGPGLTKKPSYDRKVGIAIDQQNDFLTADIEFYLHDYEGGAKARSMFWSLTAEQIYMLSDIFKRVADSMVHLQTQYVDDNRRKG